MRLSRRVRRRRRRGRRRSSRTGRRRTRRRRRRPYPLLWRTRALDGRDRLGGRKRMGAPPVHNIQPPESHWRATKQPPESQQATKKSPKSHERATRANSGPPVRKIQARLTQLQFSQVVLPAELASNIKTKKICPK